MQKSVDADSYQAAIRKALQAGDRAGIQPKPKRIASARTAAKRIGISHVSLAKHLRRGVVQAYYQSELRKLLQIGEHPGASRSTRRESPTQLAALRHCRKTGLQIRRLKRERENVSLFTQKELSRFSVTKFLAEASNQVWEGADGELTGLER